MTTRLCSEIKPKKSLYSNNCERPILGLRTGNGKKKYYYDYIIIIKGSGLIKTLLFRSYNDA